jgi:hypothetical protein
VVRCECEDVTEGAYVSEKWSDMSMKYVREVCDMRLMCEECVRQT